MNNIFLIIFIIAIVSFIYFRIVPNRFNFDLNNTKRSDFDKPSDLVNNDKLIVIKNVKIDELKKVIIQFCNSYNQDGWNVQPQLTIDKFQLIITFPYDIEFDMFCFLINYLKYPDDIEDQAKYRPEIKAWCTTDSNDKWMKKGIANKNVMLFIPEWDDEYDNVYLTTNDNLGFLMGFAIGKNGKKLDKPIIDFQSNPIDLSKLKSKETINFE